MSFSAVEEKRISLFMGEEKEGEMEMNKSKSKSNNIKGRDVLKNLKDDAMLLCFVEKSVTMAMNL